MQRLVKVLVVALVVGLGIGPGLATLVPPAAADSKTDRARKHFKQGEAYRKAKAYDLAVAEYEAAYAEVPKAGFLFNVALVLEESGQTRKAVEYYRRYLGEAGEDDGAVGEARARLAALERVVAAEDERLAREQHVAELAAAGAAHLAAGRFAEAREAYRSAHAESKDPEYLFDEAEALRGAGAHRDALAAYERYRSEAPGGPRVGTAVAHIAALEQTIADEARVKAQPPPPPPDPVVTRPLPPPPPPRAKSGISWVQVAIGAALLGGGVAVDLIPASGKNHELDALDFVPAAMYATGSVFVVRGVF